MINKHIDTQPQTRSPPAPIPPPLHPNQTHSLTQAQTHAHPGVEVLLGVLICVTRLSAFGQIGASVNLSYLNRKL